MIKTLFSILQIVVPILLIILILAQNKSVGLGAVFGGDGGFFASRRGPEKVLHQATIVVAIAFFLVTLFSVLVNKM